MSQPSLPIESSLLVRNVAGECRPANADEVLKTAQWLLDAQLRGREVLTSPQAVRDFLRVKLGGLEHEVFAVLMLDAQRHLIEYVELFRGTVSQTSVYPREVVKESLARNAVALILVHNQPSGVATPSRADEHLTLTLKAALSLVDVRVLDHLIVAVRGHHVDGSDFARRESFKGSARSRHQRHIAIANCFVVGEDLHCESGAALGRYPSPGQYWIAWVRSKSAPTW